MARDDFGDKAGWRAEMKRRLEALSPEQRRAEEGQLDAQLRAWIAGRGFDTVLATLAAGTEPDLSSFYQWWLDRGGRLALARTEAGRGLSFRFVDNLDGPWDVHPWGLREPDGSRPVWRSGPALCLVPGFAFAQRGGQVDRLGRGGGFYDRWLAENKVFTLAVGYSVQAVEALPVEAHDRALDGWLIPGFETT